jgi:uracil phosphoribosyltransferase
MTEKKSPVGNYLAVELAHEEDWFEIVSFIFSFCIVPILRSGNAFLGEMFRLMPGISVG